MILVGFGFVLFAVVSTVVGFRLVDLWRRTRQLPELLIGLGVLGIGPIGFGFLAVAMGLGERGLAAAPALAAIGSAACTGGSCAKFVFNWRVYHADSRGVRAAVYALLAVSALLYLAHATSHGFEAGREHVLWYVVRGWLQVGCLLWGSVEAFLYYERMRRRVALGLADALTTNRLLLWGIAAGAAGSGTVIGLVAVMLYGQEIMLHPVVLTSSSTCGSIAAVAMGLAFFPPAAYRAHLEAPGTRTAAR